MEFRREPSLTVGLAPPLLRSNTLLGHYPRTNADDTVPLSVVTKRDS
jgi:hypothetical protein